MQTGRSMVEMLGVLAVMAIIGLSAFKGVDYVLTKNTVSNIWKEVLVRESATRSNKSGNRNIAGFDNRVHGVQFDSVSYHAGAVNCPVDRRQWSGVHVLNADPRIISLLLERARMEAPTSLKCIYPQHQINRNLIVDGGDCRNCTDLFFIFQRGSH